MATASPIPDEVPSLPDRRTINDFRSIWNTPLQGRVLKKDTPVAKKVVRSQKLNAILVGIFQGGENDSFGVFRLPSGLEKVVRVGQEVETNGPTLTAVESRSVRIRYTGRDEQTIELPTPPQGQTMKKTVWVLLGTTGGWQVVKQGEEIERSRVCQNALEVYESFREMGYDGAPIVVGLHADQCVAGEFEYDESQPHPHTVLLYGFEEVVPFSAEELTASIRTCEGKAFAVAAPVDRLKPFLEELQDNGVAIEAISPASMLVLQALKDHSPTNQVMLCGDTNELVLVKEDAVWCWNKLPDDPDSVLAWLKLADVDSSEPVVVVGNADPLVASADDAGLDLQFKNIEESWLDLVLATGGKITGQGETAWVDLHQSALISTDPLRRIRSALIFALCGVCLGLAIVAASLFWQSNQFSSQRVLYRKQQEQQYSKLHTGAVPPSIRSRLASQWKKISRQGELASFTANQQTPIDSVLHSLLVSVNRFETSAIAAGQPGFKISSLSFSESGVVSLYIETQSRLDADRLKQQLVQDGFEILSFPTTMKGEWVAVNAEIRLKTPAESKN